MSPLTLDLFNSRENWPLWIGISIFIEIITIIVGIGSDRGTAVGIIVVDSIRYFLFSIWSHCDCRFYFIFSIEHEIKKTLLEFLVNWNGPEDVFELIYYVIYFNGINTLCFYVDDQEQAEFKHVKFLVALNVVVNLKDFSIFF